MKKDIARFRNIETNPEKILVSLNDGTKIKGILHLKSNYRIVDQLNDSNNHFIVFTDVQITNSEETKAIPFLVLNRNTINYCVSVD